MHRAGFGKKCHSREVVLHKLSTVKRAFHAGATTQSYIQTLNLARIASLGEAYFRMGSVSRFTLSNKA